MIQETYKNHKKEINDVIDFIFSKNSQILLYESEKGIGNTAFISRTIFTLKSTPSVQIFSAELSAETRNPIHAIINGITNKNNKLYQQLQMFTDQKYGTYEVPIITAIIKDLSQSDMLAALFQSKSAVPIYTGFYQNRLKEIFFILADELTKEKSLVIFIDNIQFMDAESIYELQSLLNNSKIKLVCLKSDTGENFEKFYLETKYKYKYTELAFPKPNTTYVKQLAEIYNKNLTDNEANAILFKANGNIRKILFHLRESIETHPFDSSKLQLIKTIYLYNDYVTSNTLIEIINFSPYKGIFSKETIQTMLSTLEKEGYLNTLIDFEEKNKSYRLDSDYKPPLDIADRLVISKTLLTYYKHCEKLTYKHLLQAWDYSNLLNDQQSCQKFAVSIIRTALQMGYSIDENIISCVQSIPNKQTRLLLAIFFFCNARYKQAKDILDEFISNNTNRSIKVIYAISLNRCREHLSAEKLLSDLIKTSNNIDELTILVSFLISNHVHGGKLSDATEVYNNFSEQLKQSMKYPYFLRNAATLFEPSKAYQLRSIAQNMFKEKKDLFGYYSTIVNLTSYNLRNTTINYALSQAQIAFEGLQQFGASQIHLAANNLGICYLMNNDYIEAIKYFTLTIEYSKTIMPSGYATMNLAAMYIKKQEPKKAYELICNLGPRILSSNLPRLKGRYYLYLAVIYYILDNYEECLKNCQLAIKESNFAPKTKPYHVVTFLKTNCELSNHYTSQKWMDIFAPCFLEYWTVNSVDILSDELLTF